LDDGRIEVALLHNNDAYRQRVERLLARPGTLEFRILASIRQDKAVIEQARRDQSKAEVRDPSGKRLAWWVPVKAGEEKSLGADPDVARHSKKQGITEILVVTDSCNVTGTYLTKAEASADNSGHPCINFTFNDAGGKLFAKLTGDHLPDVSSGFKYKLGIILDGELCSAPCIMSTISDRGAITGSFSKEEVADLVDMLNGGILPALRLVLIDKTAARKERSE
jgi:SecD/SecF fusion protein